MENTLEISENIISGKEKQPSYNEYYKLEEAVLKNELFEYLTSTPHYRCTPELGMESINDFTRVVENINCFLHYNPEYTSVFYNTISKILSDGNFYEVYSVANIIRKHFSWQHHKITDIVLVDDNIFTQVRKVIPKYENQFRDCHDYNSSKDGMMDFFKSWNDFLLQNTNLHIL